MAFLSLVTRSPMQAQVQDPLTTKRPTLPSALELESAPESAPELESEPEPASASDELRYTHVDVSQERFTEPSLWWSVRELGERLIPEWVVDPIERRVEFTIEPQRWNWMDYFDRYTLVTRLANVVRPSGYDVFLLDPQQPDVPVASYTCDFAVTPPTCQLEFTP